MDSILPEVPQSGRNRRRWIGPSLLPWMPIHDLSPWSKISGTDCERTSALNILQIFKLRHYHPSGVVFARAAPRAGVRVARWKPATSRPLPRFTWRLISRA